MKGEEEQAISKFLYETALSAGVPIISKDKCCQLLAWVFVYGGGHEQVVMDGWLRNAILYAQQRLNINGGEIPNMELAILMNKYIKSVSDYDNPPEWVLLLEKEYSIEVYRRKK